MTVHKLSKSEMLKFDRNVGKIDIFRNIENKKITRMSWMRGSGGGGGGRRLRRINQS